MRWALLVLAMLVAGCSEAGDVNLPGDREGDWRVSGSFDRDATQQDIEKAQGIATSYGGDMRVMESFPPQFIAAGFRDAVSCQKARDALRASPHVASVTGCDPVGGSQAAGGGSDAVTSSASLPPIATLRNASDRFLVDFDVISGGHPFKGARAADPHAGAHVHFDNAAGAWPRNGTEWPAIYAVADGVVTRVDHSFHVGDNDRYGVSLEIADGWTFGYSIEPFVPEPSPGFYDAFLLVKEGDHVAKGQVIARMYLPRLAQGPHIHFDLSASKGKTGPGGFGAPAIFTPEVVARFHERWGGFAQDGQGGAQMPACMGWKLAESENPFGTGAVDCL